MKKQKKGFTLVELIVVITILAILGTIAIMAFSGYSKNARDSARLSDVSNIKKSLELWMLKSGTYLEPTGGVDIMYMGGKVWTQGTFGDTMYNAIEKLDKKPVDPLYNVEYTYSVTKNKKEYQIGAVLEQSVAYENILLPQTYAAGGKGTAYVNGTYNGVLLSAGTTTQYLLGIPTIILSDISQTNIASLGSGAMVYEGKSNLPHSYNTTGLTMTGSDFSFTPKLLWSGNSLSELDNQNTFENLVVQIQTTYDDPVFSTLPEYTNIVGSTTSFSSALGSVKGLIENNTYQKLITIDTSVNVKPNEASCIYDGQLYLHGTGVTGYSEDNILWNAAYGCEDRKQIKTCNNGVLLFDAGYVYGGCMKGTPTNCNANPSFTFNSHIYNIPAINHGQQGLNIYTSDISITNGTKKYLLTSIDCNDGVLTNAQEQLEAILTCDTNFHTEDNETCISNTRSCTITNGTGQETWNGTTWGTCTVISCNNTFVEQSNQCLNETCNGTTPSNGKVSNATSQIGGTWNYNTTPGLCTYTCDTNYTWNGTTCVADTRTFTCPAKPANTDWNTVGSYTQTWNGTAWIPANTTTTYNTTGDTQSCRYQCSSSNHTEDAGISCISNTKTNQACTNLPTNAQYYNGTTSYAITQTWGGSWSPTLDALSAGFNATPTVNTCQWKCNANYIQSGNSCILQWSGDATNGYLYKNSTGNYQYPTSCNDLLVQSTWKNTLPGSPWNGTKFNDGVYYIKPDTNPEFKVYCDMTTDGGGWTMVLNSGRNGTISFDFYNGTNINTNAINPVSQLGGITGAIGINKFANNFPFTKAKLQMVAGDDISQVATFYKTITKSNTDTWFVTNGIEPNSTQICIDYSMTSQCTTRPFDHDYDNNGIQDGNTLMAWGLNVTKYGYTTMDFHPLHGSSLGSLGFCSTTGNLNGNAWHDSAADGHWGNGLIIYFK